MTRLYLRKIDFLFYLLIATLIFSLIPKSIGLEVLGSFGNKFAIYPLIMGMILTAYIWRVSKKRKKLYASNQNNEFQSFFTLMKWYLTSLFLVLMFSVISGVVFYPYYEQLLFRSGTSY